MDFFGLPLHPLVVHAAVVLVPLAALGALLVIASAWVRQRYGWFTVAFAVAGAGAAVTARLSGEALLQSLGGAGPALVSHQMWGQLAPFPAVILALALPAALLMENRSRAAWWVTGAVAALMALASVVLVMLTGHSGATAVWGG